MVYVPKKIPVPIGFLRSVGPSYNMFFIETMIDEVAHASNQDPLDFRRRLLDGQARYLDVLNQAAQLGNWGSPTRGQFQGLAFYRGFGSVSAQVVEISLTDGALRVDRVTCVADCGPVINPNIARQQIEGAIVFGLTAALYGKIRIEGGGVLEANFDNYRLLPINEMPQIDVHFVENDNVDQIGGLGEVGTPLVAPAVANAIRAGLGVSVRTLPLTVGQVELT